MSKVGLAAIGTLFVFSIRSVAFADAAADNQYCTALADLQERYGRIVSVEGLYQPSTADVAWAAVSCETNAAPAIQLLEPALQNAEVKPPARRLAMAPAPQAVGVATPLQTPAKPRPTSISPGERIAAQRGNALAQYDLGRRYEAGEGVPQDYALAHMWYSLSAASRSPINAMARKALDQLQATMPSESVAEAKQLAGKWTPTN